MQWDLGIRGVALLAAMAIIFGVLAHVVAGRHSTRWMWLIATAAYFAAGVFVSEVWFGWATEEELQPNIDGLSFDEVLLLAFLPGIAAVVLARYVTKRTHGGAAGHATGAAPGPA
jgi:hypothetical protein